MTKTKNPRLIERVQGLRHYRLLWAIALGLLALDQLCKLLVQQAYHRQAHTVLAEVTPFFSLVYVENTGAAWGMLSGNSFILGLLALVALGAIFGLRRALQLHLRAMQVAFGLLVAGIAGNMIDRLLLGYVVDFVDLHAWGLRFPAFNIADVSITAGVIIYIVHSWRHSPQSASQYKA